MSSAEMPSPYGTGNAVPTVRSIATASANQVPAGSAAEVAGGAGAGAATTVAGAGAVPRIRTHHLQQAKDRGEKFAMLTAYDQYAAGIFDAAGIEVLLVGDSAANNVLGYETTIPITLDEMIPLCRAVSTAVRRSFVVADLPFGSYETSPAQAIASSVRLLKEGLVSAVKMEGGAHYAPTVRAMTAAGIPVMAHIGFTPQSEHVLGGYRVQGRGDSGQVVVDDAVALAEAGAFAVLMEMVPADVAANVERTVSVPTIGIGAGNGTTGQVLVWQDMAGLRTGKTARFVKRYADLHTILSDAARAYSEDVRSGSFPGPEHSF